jgi:hypothetical protein
MVEIEDKLISDDLFKKKFVCDLQKCKGACCIEGDAGAPLTNDEVLLIEENLPLIKNRMRPQGIDAVTKHGVFYNDSEGEKVTTLINGKECAFVFFDKNNIAKCSIEAAYSKNEIDFNKPMSCHLYPIRVKKHNDFSAINIDDWHICKPACDCGKTLNIPVFKFLKDAIIRKWGKEFFNQLDEVYSSFFKRNQDGNNISQI